MHFRVGGGDGIDFSSKRIGSKCKIGIAGALMLVAVADTPPSREPSPHPTRMLPDFLLALFPRSTLGLDMIRHSRSLLSGRAVLGIAPGRRSRFSGTEEGDGRRANGKLGTVHSERADAPKRCQHDQVL